MNWLRVDSFWLEQPGPGDSRVRLRSGSEAAFLVWPSHLGGVRVPLSPSGDGGGFPSPLQLRLMRWPSPRRLDVRLQERPGVSSEHGLRRALRLVREVQRLREDDDLRRMPLRRRPDLTASLLMGAESLLEPLCFPTSDHSISVFLGSHKSAHLTI